MTISHIENLDHPLILGRIFIIDSKNSLKKSLVGFLVYVYVDLPHLGKSKCVCAINKYVQFLPLTNFSSSSSSSFSSYWLSWERDRERVCVCECEVLVDFSAYVIWSSYIYIYIYMYMYTYRYIYRDIYVCVYIYMWVHLWIEGSGIYWVQRTR